MLFGERALGTLPNDLHKEGVVGNAEAAEVIAGGDEAPGIANTEGGTEKPVVENSKVEKPRVEGEAV